MNNMSSEKRVYICFVILVIFLCSGCSTVKYEWCPDPILKPTADKETGGAIARVLEISF